MVRRATGTTRKPFKTIKNDDKSEHTPPTSSNESDDEYEVENIVGKRKYKGKTQYRVKWMGYPESENTWQDVDTMLCPELIAIFESSRQKNSPKSKEQRPLGKRLKIDDSDFGGQPGDWEDSVVAVETIIKDGNCLLVSAIFNNGRKKKVDIEVANRRCPQKMLQFYQQRLRFSSEPS